MGYTRRNFFVPVPTKTDWNEFDKWLFVRCEEDGNRAHYQVDKTITQLWEEEQKQLLTLPEYEFSVFRYETLRVDKFGFVVIENNKYAISPELFRELVQVKLFFDRVEIYYDHPLLKTYAHATSMAKR